MPQSCRRQKTSGAQHDAIFLSAKQSRVLGTVSGRAACAIGHAHELMLKSLEPVMRAS